MAVMSTSLRWLVALGPRLVALLVLVAALVLAPAPLPAEPEPCCCPRPAECTCLDRDPSAPASLRRCSQPVDAAAPVTAAPAALLPEALPYYASQTAMLTTAAAVLTVVQHRLSAVALARAVLVVGAIVVVVAAWLTGGPVSPSYCSGR